MIIVIEPREIYCSLTSEQTWECVLCRLDHKKKYTASVRANVAIFALRNENIWVTSRNPSRSHLISHRKIKHKLRPWSYRTNMVFLFRLQNIHRELIYIYIYVYICIYICIYLFGHISVVYGLTKRCLLCNYISSMFLGHVHVDIRSCGDGGYVCVKMICPWKCENM